MPTRVSFFIGLSLLLSSLVFAQAPTQLRDMAKEEPLWQQLAKVAPASVETFKRATAALDREAYDEAVQLYHEVQLKAPNVDAVTRRLGYALIGIGKKDEGMKLLRSAHDSNPSYENAIALASSLANPANGQQPSKTDLLDALSLLQPILPIASDAEALVLIAKIDLELDRANEFRQTVRRLKDVYPNLMQTHFFAAISAANDANWAQAKSEIKQAQALGLPAEAADTFLKSVEESSGLGNWKYVMLVAVILIVWALGLGLLFLLGKAFSNRTLHYIEQADPNGATSSQEAALRGWYKRLINFASIYYYISLPVVCLLVISAALAVFYAFWLLGRIPLQLIATLGIGAILTIYQSIRSLFIKINQEDPGRPLQAEEAPGLWALTREVAQAIGTRPIDEIRITPGCEMAVYEKGDLRDKLNDQAKRILILGLASLNGMRQNALRAVLAHEYGHFSNRDTAGRNRVEQDMMKFFIAMAYGGQAVWWNLAFQFLRVYHFIFRRLSHGATRLQEVLADRIAVRTYSAGAFEQGLRHIIRREIEFNQIAEKEINEARKQKRALANLYQLPASEEKFEKEMIEKELTEAITRATTEDDTHPSPIERFRLAARIASNAQLPTDEPAWNLFADPQALTSEFNDQINEHVKSAEPDETNETSDDGPKFTIIED